MIRLNWRVEHDGEVRLPGALVQWPAGVESRLVESGAAVRVEPPPGPEPEAGPPAATPAAAPPKRERPRRK